MSPASTAISKLQSNQFPNWWSFVPTKGKQTFVEKWATQPLSKDLCIRAYQTNSSYNGIGVVTGEFSGGLIALDIDGPKADARYKEYVGDKYEAPGSETTMSTSSGRAFRRQILYRVPQSLVPELRHIHKIIYKESGVWEPGAGDEKKQPAQMGVKREEAYEEVVLRFNRCQTVLPGSIHPDTGKPYKFLQYNEGEVALAPQWVLDVLREFRRPVQWLSDEDQKALDSELGETAIPSRQIRGWFFKEEVQSLLRPRLEDLIFNHETFDRYGWKTRSGDNPQRMSGCPWHGGESGTAFQYSTKSGCWDCKGCAVGGDVLDFVHKIRTNNLYADRPQGPDLEVYVAEIAEKLGFNYPEDARAQVQKEAPRLTMNSIEFHEELGRIWDLERNPAVRYDRMAQLASDTGRYKLSGKDCEAALGEYRYKLASDKHNLDNEWFNKVEDMTFLIPNLLAIPSQTILHAAGGVGKTSACLGLAKAVGKGLTMQVRGIEVPVQQGPVLWIQSDQTLAKLKRDLQDNEIDPSEGWFHLRRGFQINHMAEFCEWVSDIKPKLVVIDSIGSCSSRMQVSEIEKAFAVPLYLYSEANGGGLDHSFPACAIIWIHHDNANGEVRGNRYLINAVDEQWHLRKLSDEEREQFRELGQNAGSTRMIQIKKSRAGREGDLLKVIRDENYSFSVEDYTPTVRNQDQGQGDPDPNTLVLDIVKKVCAQQSEEGAEVIGLLREQVWEELTGRMTGLARKPPSKKTVSRWLDRWVEDGLMTRVTGHGLGGQAKKRGGRPPALYRILPSRVGALFDVSFTETPSEPSDTNETHSDTDLGVSVTPEPDLSSASTHPVSDTKLSDRNLNTVPEGDLGEFGIKVTGTGTTRASDRGVDGRPILNRSDDLDVYPSAEASFSEAFRRPQEGLDDDLA